MPVIGTLDMIGHAFAIGGILQFVRGFFAGGRALNRVPRGEAVRYLLWRNMWIWRTPNSPPTFLTDEAIALERLRRSRTLQGLVLWAVAAGFYLATNTLS